MAAFVEWLRALHGRQDADPAWVAAWRARDPAAFGAALAAFMGFDMACQPARNLVRATGPRTALVVFEADRSRQSWSRDALRTGQPALPPAVAATLAALDRDELLAITAHHVLTEGVRPDDRLLWTGPATATLPYGVLAVGATLILAPDGADVAAAEAARPIRPPPGWGPG